MAAKAIYMSELFGFEPDENGDINFLTVSTNWLISNYEEYQELFKYLVELGEQNPGVMPILTFKNESGS